MLSWGHNKQYYGFCVHISSKLHSIRNDTSYEISMHQLWVVHHEQREALWDTAMNNSVFVPLHHFDFLVLFHWYIKNDKQVYNITIILQYTYIFASESDVS